MNLLKTLTAMLAAVVLLSGCGLLGQSKKAEPAAAAQATDQKKDNGFKKYSEVITDEAESDEGLFTVHRIKEKLYYEIPFDQLETS